MRKKKNNIIEKILISIKINGFKETLNRIIRVHICRIVNEYLLKIFVKLTKNKPLKNIILIQSHGDFDCNGGAIYEYLLKNKINEKYKIVWILNNKFLKKLPENVEAYLFYELSIKKTLRICFTKYFFADDSIIKKVREDQVSIYCTHGGICFKDARKMMDFSKSKLDYVLSPSINYNPFIKMKYNLDLAKTKLLTFGYPALDEFFRGNSNNEYEKISAKIYNKYILWMPTFRRGNGNRNDSSEEFPFGIPLLKTHRVLEELNKILDKKDILLVIKIHPSQNPVTYKMFNDLSNIKMITPEIERKLDLNKYNLMKHTDALISDYSGAAYEYLLLNRPLGFLISDIETYKIGFIVEDIKKYMPGNLIENYNDFINFIKDITEGRDKYKVQREKLLNFLYDYRDDKACERLIKFLKIN